jgi:sporulation protein YlmC with PRC-barrel domain
VRTLSAIIGGIGLTVALAGPTFAQQVAATNDTPPAAMTNAPGDNGPNGSLRRYNGEFRASKLVGSNVYNQSGQTIGSVDDLLIGQDGKISQAVVSVGGFLGIGGKLVAVPFGEFKFVESRKSTAAADSDAPPMTTTMAGTSTGTATGTATTTVPAHTMKTSDAEPVYFSIVLPSATKNSLSSAAEFKYQG